MKEPPEDSVRLRVVVAAMVMVAVVAVVSQGATDGFTSAAAVALVPAGYVFSYAQRRRSNVPAKVVLAVGLLAALGGFLQSVRFAETVDEARMPLASLFLWVQVLHSFDVPRRRDLAFSAVSSLILMAEAGSLSFDMVFLLYLVPWVVIAGLWLSWTHRPIRDEVQAPTFVRRLDRRSGDRLAAGRGAVTTGVACVVAVALVFLAMPRLPGAYVRLPPFSVAQPLSVPAFDGSVVNPSLPAAGGDGVVDFTSSAYPGFGSRVDLRARGRLSDRVVMLVRSPQAALWRGQVYDTFDGTAWTASDPDTVTVGQSVERSFPLGLHGETLAPTNRIVTTFYLQQPEPNIVFAAYAPGEVFFPAAQLSFDRYGSIRSPILLDAGLVYSVISHVPVTSPEMLRRAPATWSRAELRRYTQLPEDLPQRVVDLATRITEGARTTYDRVVAIEAWLRANTRYDLDIPRDPRGVDAVDHFLFETRRGFCEHIASAMIVLLRAVGIPARFVTGFGPGGRNAFTGYLEVRESDAHAWVEVLYPSIGWVQYDPTFGVPAADPGAAGWFVAPQVLRGIGRFVLRIVPGPVRTVVRETGNAIAAASRAVVDVWPVAAVAGLLALALPLVLRRRRARGLHPPPAGAAAAFVRLTRALAARGHPRQPWLTPSEYLRSIRDDERLPAEVLPDAEVVVRVFERERFGDEAPVGEEVAAAHAAARRVAASKAPAPAR